MLLISVGKIFCNTFHPKADLNLHVNENTYAIITAPFVDSYIVRIALKTDLLRLVGKVAPYIGDHVPHAQPKLLHERHNAVDLGVARHGLAHANVRGRARW